MNNTESLLRRLPPTLVWGVLFTSSGLSMHTESQHGPGSRKSWLPLTPGHAAFLEPGGEEGDSIGPIFMDTSPSKDNLPPHRD